VDEAGRSVTSFLYRKLRGRNEVYNVKCGGCLCFGRSWKSNCQNMSFQFTRLLGKYALSFLQVVHLLLPPLSVRIY